MKLSKIITLVVGLMLLLSVSAFASPDVVWPGDVGNASDIIVITNPPKDKSATFDQSYIISGYGKEGATVAIYKFFNDIFNKSDYEWQIGASGMFFKRIDLGKGRNILLCRGEDNSGNYQNVKLEITYLGNNLSDVVDGISVDINDLGF